VKLITHYLLFSHSLTEPVNGSYSQPYCRMTTLRTSEELHVRMTDRISVRCFEGLSDEGLIGCHRCRIVATRTQLIRLESMATAELGVVSRYAVVVQWLPISHSLWDGCTRMALILHGALLTRQHPRSHKEHVEMPFSVGWSEINASRVKRTPT
jgi:hypothetical protein